MEIVTETAISETANSERQNPISDKQTEISGTGDSLLNVSETPNQIRKVNSGDETPKNGTPDGKKKAGGEKQFSAFKTPTPDEKTDEKQRILLPKSPNPAGKEDSESKTPTPVKQIGQTPNFVAGIELPRNGTPIRLKVPKAFKYPERYTSPTDLMMSPISKGLLARTRKGVLPSKMQELRIPEMSLMYQS